MEYNVLYHNTVVDYAGSSGMFRYSRSYKPGLQLMLHELDMP